MIACQRVGPQRILDGVPDDPSVLPPPLQEILGDNVRAYRKHHRLTQEGLASRLGLTVRYVRGIELGEHNLTLRTIDAIAEKLDVEPLQLLTGGTWDAPVE